MEPINNRALCAWSIKRSLKDTAIQTQDKSVHSFCTSDRRFKSSISLFTEKVQSCQEKKACYLFSAYQTQQLTRMRRSPLSKNNVQSDILLWTKNFQWNVVLLHRAGVGLDSLSVFHQDSYNLLTPLLYGIIRSPSLPTMSVHFLWQNLR